MSNLENWGADQQLLFYKCQSVNNKIQSLLATQTALNEALKRVRLEAQAIPEQLEKIKNDLKNLYQDGSQKYQDLKVLVSCPDGKEINLEDGEFITPSQQDQTNPPKKEED